MPVHLTEMRNLMLPGMRAAAADYAFAAWSQKQWAELFDAAVPAVAPVALPSLPVVAAMGATALVMKNPVVARRNLFNWFRGA